jgi:MtrB/PioB family decaheme-associated outer membrane protein
MLRKAVFSCFFVLLLLSYAYPGETPLSGGIFLGGRAISLDRESAKFNEYNALSPGLFGGADVSYDREAYHVNTQAAYLGSDDLFIRFRGGKWGSFKYSLFHNEFPHNLSFGARSIYNNPGSENLVFSGPAPAIPRDPGAWPSGSFDYKFKRKDTGGSLDVTALNPFFFTIDGNRLQRQGQIPWGAPSGLAPPTGSPFGRTVEFPLAIDDSTTNINALAGWKSKGAYLALGAGFSKYSDQAEITRFRDPFTTGPATATAATVWAPDNKSWNVKFTGTAKLPFASTFALSGGYQKNTSETRILNTIEAGSISAPIAKQLLLSDPIFNGDVRYWNINAALSSNPVKKLNTRIYFKYLDRENRSDLIQFVDPVNGAASFNEIFDHTRTTIGTEASYRFLRNLKGILGYEFSDVKRRAQEFEGDATEDPEFPEIRIPNTWDHRINAQLVYNPLEWLGTRIRYQKLYRGASFMVIPGDPTDPNTMNAVLDNFTRRFHASKKTQDMVRFSIDLTAIQNLGLSFEYAYKYDDYYKTVLGLEKTKTDEFIIDASYDWKGIRLFAFFDYETSFWRQTQRQVTPGANANADPTSGVVNANSFNWEARLNNSNYAYGLGTSFPIIKDKLSFVVQYDFEKNNGNADFTSQFLSANLNQDIIDIPRWDDYTRQTISARLKYDHSKDLALVFGYLYSQFRWNDDQFRGYQYVMPVTGAVNTYLSGAYTDQTYKANIYYLKVLYKF